MKRYTEHVKINNQPGVVIMHVTVLFNAQLTPLEDDFSLHIPRIRLFSYEG